MAEKAVLRVASRRQRRLLIVEDDVLIRMNFAAAARDAGYRVAEAATAGDALSFIRSRRRVDLVFTDINMPGSMDGIELVQRLAAEYPGVKAVLTSGGVPAGAVQSTVPFLRKPYKIPDALALIGRLLASNVSNG